MINGLVEIIHGNNPLLMVAAGLAMGLLHAFEPDHLSSMSTQASRTGMGEKTGIRRAGTGFAAKGMLWGAGHTFSIVLAGLLVAGLSLHISGGFFAGAELAAGLVLVALGVMTATGKGIPGRLHMHLHMHPHRHPDGTVHTHPHMHGEGRHTHGHRFYIIGCIQGLAGSGGLVALAASVMPNLESVVYFLVLFGAGSVAGMTAASGLMGLPFALLPRTDRAAKCTRYAISGTALIIGTGMVISLLGA